MHFGDGAILENDVVLHPQIYMHGKIRIKAVSVGKECHMKASAVLCHGGKLQDLASMNTFEVRSGTVKMD